MAERTDYLTTFPGVRSLEPVTDPHLVADLNAKLVAGIFDLTARISLTIPDIVDYGDESFVNFAGAGISQIFEDVYIKHYRLYLQSAGLSADSLDHQTLVRHKLQLLDGDLVPKHRYSIYRSLVFETPIVNGHSFHLSGGVWYCVARELLSRLREYLDARWVKPTLPDYSDERESKYNERIAGLVSGICLDTTNIADQGMTPVEPCDIVRLSGDRLELIHIKIGTNSDKLSHHFSQGTNSLTLLRESSSAREKLVSLAATGDLALSRTQIESAVFEGRVDVTFGIVTHKDPLGMSDNLPLFSRISLRQQLRAIELMGGVARFEFIKDTTEKAGKVRASKPKGSQ
jgi:uncharacterized protein (TIGR04141 family)